MKKLPLAVVVSAVAMAMSAQIASAQIVTVFPNGLPVPITVFDGTYANADANNRVATRSQEGYVAVFDDGVEACNGNEELTRPDNGEPLQGYIWIGSEHAASNPAAADPSGTVGAGNGDTDNDGIYEEGEGEPCPQGNFDSP